MSSSSASRPASDLASFDVGKFKDLAKHTLSDFFKDLNAAERR